MESQVAGFRAYLAPLMSKSVMPSSFVASAKALTAPSNSGGLKWVRGLSRYICFEVGLWSSAEVNRRAKGIELFWLPNLE